ncbi:MAG TPA: hypothetical protein VHV10_08460 [Ktedonobacteraceae bacterium]|nr:hypothetical protein [Ktedonobacteraceae bacterium]
MPFTGATTRQNAGTNADSDEFGSDADSQHHMVTTPTPYGRANRLHTSEGPSPRVQNVPAFVSNDADLAGNLPDQFQMENFSSGDFSTTPGRIITKYGLDLSATPGLPRDAQIGSVADNYKFTFRNTTKSASLANSASPEPSPATSKTWNNSKGLSEAAETGFHGDGALQGRQNPNFQQKSQISANFGPNEAVPKPGKATRTSPPHSLPISKKGNHSKSGQVAGNPQEQSGIGMRRVSGVSPAPNPPRLGTTNQTSLPGKSRSKAETVQPPRLPQITNFFAPLDEFPALPPRAPPATPTAQRSSHRRRRDSSDSEPDHTVKMRLLRRPEKLSAQPQVDKTHASSQRSTVSFAPLHTVAPSGVDDDVDMQSETEGSAAVGSDGEQADSVPAATSTTYAQATQGSNSQGEPASSPVAPQPPSPSANSHQVAQLFTEAEQLLAAALERIELATSLGGNLSPRLKQVLGNLGSTVKEEELLKKVGDLVESKLAAAFAQAASTAPSLPPPAKPTATKSANPVPIRPTRVTPPTPKPKPAPKSGAARHHPARLILQVRNPESCRPKPPTVAARDATNNVLREFGDDVPQVAGVTYTAAGNIVVIARPPHTATDLLPYVDPIGAAILGSEAECVGLPDLPWYRVQVNTVPVHYQGNVMAPEDVLHELHWSLGDSSFLTPRMMASAPRWMCSPAELAKKNHASVVFSFWKEEDALRFKEAGTYLIWGKWCKTATYEDRPQVRYCANCWSIEHPTTACRRQVPRCRLCAQDHATDQHKCAHCGSTDGWCAQDTAKCCNCKGSHAANAYDCPERKRKLGQFAKKTAEPVKRKAAATPAAAPTAAPQAASSQGEWQTVQPAGGRKTKKNRKSKAKAVPMPQPTPTPAIVEPVKPRSTVRRVHSDPNLTPSRAGPSRAKESWATMVEMDMDVETDNGLFGIPVPTGDHNLPDLV